MSAKLNAFEKMELGFLPFCLLTKGLRLQVNICRIKFKSHETVEQYKARLVIFGNNQIEGKEYTENFAPIAKLVIVLTLLVIAVTKGWEIH